MTKYTSIEDLKSLSVNDIENFLKHYWKTEEFVFVATFVSEKKELGKRSGRFKNFRKRGDKYFLKYPLSTYFVSFTVPANKPLEDGDYIVPCQILKTPQFSYPFCLQVKLKSIQRIDDTNYKRAIFNIKRKSIDGSLSKDDTRYFDLCKPKPKGWGTKQLKFLVGFYEECKGQKIFSKIWTRNFRKIETYPNSNISVCPLVVHSNDLIPEQVYTFNWEFSNSSSNIYDIVVAKDSSFRNIDAKSLIEILYKDSMENESRDKDISVSAVETIKKQVSGQDPCTFLYELLQNANDDPDGDDVEVEIRLTCNMLVFRHTGKRFTAPNVLGICGVGDGDKGEDKEAIGYKGIGFKNVFIRNGYVYIKTGDYSFSFDESSVGNSFMTTPKWEEREQLDSEINDILNQDQDKFQVNIFMIPRTKKALFEEENNYKSLLHKAFDDIKQILFISNINKVSVMIEGEGEFVCSRNKNGGSWVFSKKYSSKNWPKGLTNRINERLKEDQNRLPDKMANKTNTFASFACQTKDGAIITQENQTHIYCGLKAEKAKWGFPFEMNTDMVPTGPRDDIESGEFWNAEWSEMAGAMFFNWLNDLIDDKSYYIASVFRLVPNFELCKVQHDSYKVFIDKFQKGFEAEMKDEVLIPIKGGNKKKLSDTILDTTGLTTTDIMTDDEFLKFSNFDDRYLPLPELRKDKNFLSFLKRYVNDNMKFNEDKLHDMIGNGDFQKWLKVQDNNNKFLNFLLESNLLKDFLDEEIFLDDNDSLQKADALYYDVDKYLEDLQTFTSYIHFLSPKTRTFFKDNEKWYKIIDNKFANFNCDDFVNNELLSCANKASTIESLKTKDTSIHFFKFLAENVTFIAEYTSLPFIADDETAVDDFKDKFLFFTSEKGHKVCESEWMSSIPVAFISNDYAKVTKDYLKENFRVQIFSDEIIVNGIILSDDYHDGINESQQENKDTSVAFVKYCFEHESLFGSGSLRNYALNSYDCNGNESFVLYEAHIFFPSECFDEYSQKVWLNYNWMYGLDSDYIKVNGDEKKVKAFLKNAFYIEDFAADIFYKDIVRPNVNSIVSNTSGSNDCDGAKNLDFIAYLDANYSLVFEKEKDADIFNSFILISDADFDIKSDATYIYAFDTELKEILDSEWFPADIVNMCTSKYGESKSIVAIKAKKYDFANFFNDVITKELNNINDTIKSKEASIAFHSFITDRLADLTDKQKEVMKGAKVYLYGNNDASDRSDGHHILSKSARELVTMGFVESSDLDIISPDYKIEENLEYWETRLGNTKYTVNHFFTWLKANADTFCNTLQDQELNIKFWRWMKKNSLESHLSEMPAFSVLLKDGSIGNSSDAVYFSDDYMDGAGIEHIVQEYDEQALFISPDYIDEGDNVEEWKKFWTIVGVKFEIVDILVETVIPNLTNIDDEHLPRLLAENRESLEKQYEDAGLVAKLSELRVKGHDGKFYPINEAIYIDCEKDEPFPYIKLPNQITYPSADERRLIKDIIEEVDGDCVGTLSEWQQCKVDCYLAMQNEDEDPVRSFHYQFINELSTIRNADRDSLKKVKNIEKILLLDKNEEFCDASSLTMGSAYHPFFDFENCGIENLDYVSDSYVAECSEYVGKLFGVLKVHCDFLKEDVRLLEERGCSIYFWQTYLTKRDDSISRIEGFINEHLLDGLACIPTKNYMKKPCELYYGSEVSKYVKSIEDWENKIPLSSLPEIKLTDDTTLFSKLPFKKSLDFLDALYALVSVLGQERRTQLLNWMIDSYNESYDEKIEEYRNDEHALWKNNKNEDVHIKKLYALDYWTKTLDQYFGSNPRIINKAYFPTGDSFKEACDILCVKTITSEDLKMEPINDSIYHAREVDHKIYALVIAGMTDADNWHELYEGYCQKLDELVLHKCKSIMITYKDDEDINQSLKKFYRKEEDCNFYFVDSLDGKRVFKSFVEEFVKFLGIDIDEIAEDVIEDIMDSRENALEIVKEQNNLMLDEKFKDELDNLIPGIKRELSGNEVYDNEDEEPVTYRPTFTTTDFNSEEGEEDNYESDGSDYDNEDADETSGSISQSGDFSEGSGPTTQNPHSDKGSNHDYPSEREPRVREPRTDTSHTNTENPRNYSDMSGWKGPRGENTLKVPKPFFPEDVRNFGSHGVTRTLDILEPTTSEVEEINRILGEDLTSAQVADQNYLAQLRLYNNLVNRGMTPEESKDDFVRNAHLKNEHTLYNGKYIHKCSAAGGIMYLSPSIWNKIADARCVVCVYLGAKSNEFMYFNSIDEILEWIREDDIIIKLTGKEKADVVEKLYSGVLNDVKGTAYTLIRINSNVKYNSLFAQLPINNDINETEENEDEYGD